MKILYLFTRDKDATADALMAGQAEEHSVSQLDLRAETDYEKIVRKIEEADRIICW
ncbi:MAG: hypothetical protein P8130_03150 [Deltaproteobacteria bacterium]